MEPTAEPNVKIVYLDYNVMVNLIDGRLPEVEAQVTHWRESGRAIFPFTREHVVEAVRGIGPDSPKRVVQRAAATLEGMSDLTADTYLYQELESGHFLLLRQTPQEVHDETCVHDPDFYAPSGIPELDRATEHVLEQFRLAVQLYDQVLDQFGSQVEVADLKERLRALDVAAMAPLEVANVLMETFMEASVRAQTTMGPLGLAPKQMNNIAVSDLDKAVAERFAAAGFEGHSLSSLAEAAAEHGREVGNHPIAMDLALLGAVGFNRDRARIGAASRISDSNHANVGLRTDIFVTLDASFRKRCLAVAERQGLPVAVVSPSKLSDAIAL